MVTKTIATRMTVFGLGDNPSPMASVSVSAMPIDRAIRLIKFHALLRGFIRAISLCIDGLFENFSSPLNKPEAKLARVFIQL